MTSSRVIILSWNPSVFDFEDEEEISEESWSCQSYKKTKKGDKFIFVRAGDKDPGLVSFGEVTSDPYPGEKTWAGKAGYFVDIKFFVPFCRSSEPIIPRDELYKKFKKDIKERTFSPQSSGAELDPEVAKDLWPFLLSLRNQAVEEVLRDGGFEEAPKATLTTVRKFFRSSVVKEDALKHAKGICQLCGKQGPFKHKGSYFLEAHHVIPLSENGPDGLENVIALCPNCHRKMHLINDRKDKDFLLERAKKLSKK